LVPNTSTSHSCDTLYKFPNNFFLLVEQDKNHKSEKGILDIYNECIKAYKSIQFNNCLFLFIALHLNKEVKNLSNSNYIYIQKGSIVKDLKFPCDVIIIKELEEIIGEQNLRLINLHKNKKELLKIKSELLNKDCQKFVEIVNFDINKIEEGNFIYYHIRC
jgi:hypothetical protein